MAFSLGADIMPLTLIVTPSTRRENDINGPSYHGEVGSQTRQKNPVATNDARRHAAACRLSPIPARLWPLGKEDQRQVALLRPGKSWAKSPKLGDEAVLAKALAAATVNPVIKAFRKLLDALGLYRPGLGCYALRYTFETIASEAKDQFAVDAIMGHADSSMAAVYRERISDERLQAVVNFVRDWLRTSGRGPQEKEPGGGWGDRVKLNPSRDRPSYRRSGTRWPSATRMVFLELITMMTSCLFSIGTPS